MFTDLSDADLEKWIDAFRAETESREHLNGVVGELVNRMTDTELAERYAKALTEQRRRGERELMLRAAHEIEQGEAKEGRPVLTDADRRALLTRRAARLFRLAQVNAPDFIISEAIRLVVEAGPKEVVSPGTV